jgi:outer membrane protein assembly factor BamB
MFRASLIVILLLGAVPAVAADWPMFRGGPSQTGVAADVLDGAWKPLWVFEVEDAFEATATVVGDTVYVGALDGHLYAVDLGSGAQKWKYKATGGIKAVPSVRAGVVYVGDDMGIFHAVEAASGKSKWTFETEAEIVSSANFVGDAIVFGSHDESLYCLELDGKLRWKVQTQGYVYGTPGVIDGKVISTGCDGLMRVVSASDGTEVSSIELGSYVGASPAIHAGRVYVGTFDNQVLAVDLAAGKKLWTYEHATRKFPFLSSGATDGELFVLGGRDKMVHAIDVETGKARWTWNGGARIDSSPVISGERVFVGSQSGDIVALDLDSGKVSWRFETGSPITASPSIASGRLLIGTVDGQLYCFGPQSAQGTSTE